MARTQRLTQGACDVTPLPSSRVPQIQVPPSTSLTELSATMASDLNQALEDRVCLHPSLSPLPYTSSLPPSLPSPSVARLRPSSLETACGAVHASRHYLSTRDLSLPAHFPPSTVLATLIVRKVLVEEEEEEVLVMAVAECASI